MNIQGFIKTSLLDFPGNIASTVFTSGCNFNCPFCHNPSLILDEGSDEIIQTDVILAHLKKRQGLIDGVCITGGEATLQKNLLPFIREVKKLGMKVKLDTNGYSPSILQNLIEDNLVDYIAMDIKNSPSKYAKTCGLKALDYSKIKESIQLIKASGISHEFRTTIMKDLHDLEDLEAISEEINGCDRFCLQQYRYQEGQNCQFSAYEPETLISWQEHLTSLFKRVEVRGI
ncbi:anaerobic ribonucleoside-triphosphate reductase activating protein [Vallitalea okinawensis]|uniref:anaerobic ribonucleoside-triphosphate reductase activating protein n=1 Tax=Vallitalea okinawensis TaxID=2078660 RepID=UPI000CFC8F25|nr:anaerobic ribonucleoside-triphosphate reductase activating protein [Vallitalea okinawensis]